MYLNDDVILTEFGEIMTYEQAKSTNTLVERGATKKETVEYVKELNYWSKEESENQAASSYHELPD